jgi:hypothetical protein
MKGRKLGSLLAVGTIMAMGACGDPTGLAANFPNRELGMIVFPLNGSAQTLPAGILIRAPELARVDLRWAFDIAFDFAPGGGITVYTVRSLGSTVVPSLPRIGLQTDTTTYENLKRAPTTGFAYDSVMTVPFGRTVVIDKLDASCAQFGGSILGYNIRAKMVIDSANATSRAIYVRMLSNPNCGFRSLLVGTPKD